MSVPNRSIKLTGHKDIDELLISTDSLMREVDFLRSEIKQVLMYRPAQYKNKALYKIMRRKEWL